MKKMILFALISLVTFGAAAQPRHNHNNNRNNNNYYQQSHKTGADVACTAIEAVAVSLGVGVWIADQILSRIASNNSSYYGGGMWTLACFDDAIVIGNREAMQILFGQRSSNGKFTITGSSEVFVAGGSGIGKFYVNNNTAKIMIIVGSSTVDCYNAASKCIASTANAAAKRWR